MQYFIKNNLKNNATYKANKKNKKNKKNKSLLCFSKHILKYLNFYKS